MFPRSVVICDHQRFVDLEVKDAEDAEKAVLLSVGNFFFFGCPSGYLVRVRPGLSVL